MTANQVNESKKPGTSLGSIGGIVALVLVAAAIAFSLSFLRREPTTSELGTGGFAPTASAPPPAAPRASGQP